MTDGGGRIPKKSHPVVGEGSFRISQGFIVVALMAITGWAYNRLESSFADNSRQDAVTQEHSESVARVVAERDRELDSLKSDVKDLRADIRNLESRCH